MAAKRSGFLGLMVYAVFTSLLGPLLVHLLTDRHSGREIPVPKLVAPAEWNHPKPHPAFDPEERIIAQGVGRTAEEAWDDALCSALRSSISALVDQRTWSEDGNSINAAMLGDARGLVSRCQELSCVCDRGVWRREVAVFVDRATLAARLRALGVLVTSTTG
jgi:hypothetical protein